jgi:hypothetical protein
VLSFSSTFKLGITFRDADEFHSTENKIKMTNSIPLTDEVGNVSHKYFSYIFEELYCLIQLPCNCGHKHPMS